MPFMHFISCPCPQGSLWHSAPAKPPFGRSRQRPCGCIYPPAPKPQPGYLSAHQLSVLGSIPFHPATGSQLPSQARPTQHKAGTERHGSCSPTTGTDTCPGWKAGRRGPSRAPSSQQKLWRSPSSSSSPARGRCPQRSLSPRARRRWCFSGPPPNPRPEPLFTPGQGSTHHQPSPSQQLLRQRSPPACPETPRFPICPTHPCISLTGQQVCLWGQNHPQTVPPLTPLL